MKLSVIGTGYIAKRFLSLCKNYKDVEIQYVLTKRSIESITDFPYHDKLTNDPEKILDSEIVFEASNDSRWACCVLNLCVDEGIKIATYDTELHVQFGSYFLSKTKYFTECLGDQPGCFARLRNKIVDMGLKPYSYINYKRYMNYNPSEKDMVHWSNMNGNSLKMTISSTDGTKVAYETCLIANAFGIDPLSMEFIESESMDEVIGECKYKLTYGKKLASVWINSTLPKGILILADPGDQSITDLNYLGLMKDDTCVFQENYHLCHFEIIDTLRDLYYRDIVLLNAPNQEYNVYAKSKKFLKKGTYIDEGIGSYEVRGDIARHNEDFMPISLLHRFRLREDIPENEFIKLEYLEEL